MNRLRGDGSLRGDDEMSTRESEKHCDGKNCSVEQTKSEDIPFSISEFSE